MEKELGSWFPYQQTELQSAYSNFADPLVLRGQDSVPAFMSADMKDASVDRAFTMALYSDQPLSKANQPAEPCNWFYRMPRLRQAFVHPSASEPKEKLAYGQVDNGGLNGSANAVDASTVKRFLVFDQSGDQTSLIYSSGVRTPIGCLTSWNPQPPSTCDVNVEDLLLKGNANPWLPHFQNLDIDRECHGYSMENDMREDTEELNALLYSDDENDYSEDDEVTSTGHSPSTMTDQEIQNLSLDGDEEVADSSSSTKRLKLLDGAYNVPPLIKTLVPEKPFKSCELEEDAESCCGNFDDQVSGESVSVSGRKRSRKERIRRTLSILQNIIPGAKGKDAVMVIDEAVHYLKFLKAKAQSLGLDML